MENNMPAGWDQSNYYPNIQFYPNVHGYPQIHAPAYVHHLTPCETHQQRRNRIAEGFAFAIATGFASQGEYEPTEPSALGKLCVELANALIAELDK